MLTTIKFLLLFFFSLLMNMEVSIKSTAFQILQAYSGLILSRYSTHDNKWYGHWSGTSYCTPNHSVACYFPTWYGSRRLWLHTFNRQQYLPLDVDLIPPHKSVKSTYNITHERGWHPIHEHELSNICHAYKTGKITPGFHEGDEIHEYVFRLSWVVIGPLKVIHLLSGVLPAGFGQKLFSGSLIPLFKRAIFTMFANRRTVFYLLVVDILISMRSLTTGVVKIS